MNKATIALAALSLAVLSTSCTITDGPARRNPEAVLVQVGLTGGRLDSDADSPPSGNVDAYGYSLGGRFQISKRSPDFPIEIGLRIGVVHKDVDKRSGGPLRLDAEGIEASIAPTMRYWIPRIEGSVRPYVEGFVGYGHTWGKATYSDSLTSARDRSDGGGLFVGGGVGFEVLLSEDLFLNLGAEFTHSDYDIGVFDLNDDAITGFLSIGTTF